MNRNDICPITGYRARSAKPDLLAALAAAVVCALFFAQASAQMAIDGHVIAGGGGSSTSPGGCLHLDATIGEPVTGNSSAAGWVLDAGYWAGIGAGKRNSLFNSGFEECQ
ncbi:MAG: hypothetical protein WBW61_12105 [Rhodanobacteraceae bacterium]